MTLLSSIDHLVYATTNLDQGAEEIEKLLGTKASPGGQHPGRGTRNVLIGLGETIYLEIIGPDPEQPQPREPRSFGIDLLDQPRLVTWAIKASDLNDFRDEAMRNGVPYDEVRDGARERPDGIRIAWQVINPLIAEANGILPFFIDWGNSPHPAETTDQEAKLLSLRAEHPEANRVGAMLRTLGIDLEVSNGPSPALIAVIECPNGQVELK